MLPRKIFENLHTVVVILSKFCLNFLPLNLSVLPNMMQFVRVISMQISCLFIAKGVKLVVIEKVQNYQKIVLIKEMFKNG